MVVYREAWSTAEREGVAYSDCQQYNASCMALRSQSLVFCFFFHWRSFPQLLQVRPGVQTLVWIVDDRWDMSRQHHGNSEWRQGKAAGDVTTCGKHVSVTRRLASSPLTCRLVTAAQYVIIVVGMIAAASLCGTIGILMAYMVYHCKVTYFSLQLSMLLVSALCLSDCTVI